MFWPYSKASHWKHLFYDSQPELHWPLISSHPAIIKSFLMTAHFTSTKPFPKCCRKSVLKLTQEKEKETNFIDLKYFPSLNPIEKDIQDGRWTNMTVQDKPSSSAKQQEKQMHEPSTYWYYRRSPFSLSKEEPNTILHFFFSPEECIRSEGELNQAQPYWKDRRQMPSTVLFHQLEALFLFSFAFTSSTCSPASGSM